VKKSNWSGLLAGLVVAPLAVLGGYVAGTVAAERAIRRRDSVPARLPDAVSAPPVEQPAAPEAPAEEEVSPEVILVLSAAVAAFLGKKARIRGARLVRTAPSSAWTQAGRVYIQASHALGRAGR
jgi:methylmalonyl-CoA carboxyltransferase large subunit